MAPHRHIWIVIGPAGSGKSSVGEYLATQLESPYIEGDNFHPPANIEKMANQIPLTDADRWDWLILLRQEAVLQLASGAQSVVVTCSALKQKYRDVIRMAAYSNQNILVHFLYLQCDEATLLARVKSRAGHYMKDSMVRSQILSLEPPTADESDAIIVQTENTSLEQVKQLSLEVVRKVHTKDNTAPATAL